MSIPIRDYLNLLRDYLRPQRLRVVLLAIILIANIAFQLISPQLLRRFIDAATQGEPEERLFTLAIVFIVLSFLAQAAIVAATFVGENVGWTATNEMRSRLAEHCLRLDMAFHKQHPSGELIERIDGDIDALSNFFSQFIIGVLSNLLLMGGVLVLLWLEDWRIGLVMTLFALVALATLVRLRSLAVASLAASRESSAQFFGFLGEHLAGTEDLRANGATGYVMRSFYRLLQRWMPVQLRATRSWYVLWMTTIGLFALGNALAFGAGAVLLRAGAITLGTVYMIFHYTELLRRPIEQIRTQIQDLQRAGASIGRVRELFALEPTIVDGAGATLPDGPLEVRFENVSFHYDDGESVLDGLSFALRPGRVLGLLGRTGSGKTTVARLLLRLYDPVGGAVRLGGADLREVPVDDLRRRVGSVTQDVQLFHATIRDNLTFFNRAIPDERVLWALHELGFATWLERMPAGLDTEIEGSSGLSAGEAQLLAFARLFLADPGLIILDEASSRLDPATEQLIERAITRLLKGRTAIIIAHRLATVQRADEILILEQGRILEHGAREQLAADHDSRFAELLQLGLAEVLA